MDFFKKMIFHPLGVTGENSNVAVKPGHLPSECSLAKKLAVLAFGLFHRLRFLAFASL